MTSMTALTDYALAAVTAALGLALVRGARENTPRRLWGWAFVALALAGVLGGVWHAHEHDLGPATLAWIWRVNEWSIGLFGLGAVAATTFAAFPDAAPRVRPAVLAFLAFLAWTWDHDAFRYVLMWNLAVMALVLGMHLTRLRRDPATPWIVAGIVASAGAAALQVSSLAIGPVDHNGLFHLVQLAAMLLLFAGARRLRGSPSTIPPGLPK